MQVPFLKYFYFDKNGRGLGTRLVQCSYHAASQQFHDHIHKYIEIRETGYKTEYNIVVAVGVDMYVCDVI